MIVTLFLDVNMIHAAGKIGSIEYGNGVSYYGEVKNGKPHGTGTMTWNKSKTYKGSWSNGKRFGYGVYRAVTSQNEAITDSMYTGYWKNDKKDGKGQLTVRMTAFDATILENSIQTGTFTKDIWVTGYEARHGEYDPPYAFVYKDNKLYLEILGGDEENLEGLKNGYFFSFTYKKGKVYKSLGVGEEFNQQELKTFIQSVEKEIKPHIDQFTKLAQNI
jgi:hypothetical protein